jgi:uncharacterized protein (UPF0297 family)
MVNYEELDNAIVPIIKELNDKGYVTRDSCSGHIYNGRQTQAYISFGNVKNGKFTKKQKDEIIEILKQHGVRVSPWMNDIEWDNEEGADEYNKLHNIDAIRFPGFGRSRAGKWVGVRRKLEKTKKKIKKTKSARLLSK